MASMAMAQCGLFTAHVNSPHDERGAYTAQTISDQPAYSGPMDEIAETRALWDRINRRLRKMKLSERKAGEMARSVDTLRNIGRAAKEGRPYSPRANTLASIAVVLKTTPDWLLHENGPEDIADIEVARAALGLLAQRRHDEDAAPGAGKSLRGQIREIEIHAGMGGGGVPSHEMVQIIGRESYADDAVRGYWVFPEHALRAMGLDPGHADIVPGVGNSMEPDIRSGDWCVVDRRHRTPSPDGIYALWDGFSVVCKSLQIIPNSDPPKVRIISKNPTYPMDERTLDEVAIIGRVVSVIRNL